MRRVPDSSARDWSVRVFWILALLLVPLVVHAAHRAPLHAHSTDATVGSLPLTPTDHAIDFSQQSCNTDCQERQTDCALRCDQDAPCIRRCRAEAEDCTRRCVRAPEATPPTPATQGLSEAAELDVLPPR